MIQKFSREFLCYDFNKMSSEFLISGENFLYMIFKVKSVSNILFITLKFIMNFVSLPQKIINLFYLQWKK